MPIQLGDAGTPVYIPPNPPAPSAGADARAGIGTGGATNPDTPSASYTPTATAPPVAPPTPAPSVSFGGSTPNYSALIQSDPGYVSAQNAATLAQQNGDAARRAAVRAAYVQYGGTMPSGWADTYGDIDQATKDAAAGNQFSTNATIQNNYQQSVEQFKRALAARGMLQSGDLNYGQDQLNRGEGQQQYDAGNAYMGQYNQALNNYTGVLGQNAQNLGVAVSAAEGNVQSNPAYQPVAPITATYDPSNSAALGTAVYAAPDGTLYDASGNLLSPSASAATGQAPPSGVYYNAGFGGGYVPAGGF